MKKAVKRSLWIGIPIVIIAVAGVIYTSSNKAPQYSTVEAVSANIKQLVEATGSVASAEDLKLSFQTTGRIQRIYVKTGDKVKSGQTLAQVLDLSLSSKVERARGAVIAAQANLDKVLAGAKSEDIAVSQEKINNAISNVETAKITLANEIASRDKYQQAYIDNALQTIDDALFTVSYSLDSVYDGILDEGAKIDLLTTQADALNSAKTKYDGARVAETKAIADRAIADSKSKSDVLNVLTSARQALDESVALVNSAFTVISGGIPKGTYTQTILDSWGTTYNTRAGALTSQKSSVQTAVSNLTTGWIALDDNYNNAIAGVKSAEDALALAQAQHQALIADPKNYEIKQQQAMLLQAQADLSSAQSDYADTLITAPVAGQITNVNMKQGELAGPSNVVIDMIGDNNLQIDVDIPEADISKIQVGQVANILLDAFGSDRKFTGKVAFVEPSERLIQDVVYYRLTVVFDEENQDIKPGMTADVTITTAERQNVVAVPLRAVIIDKDGNKTVRVLENEQPVIRTVITGIRGDDGLIEIISGLEVGETVITGEVKK